MKKAYWRQRPLAGCAATTVRVKDDIEGKLLRYLSGWPEGLTTARMGAWIHSCTRLGGYSEREYDDALRKLRDSGRIAIANGIWYLRGKLRDTKDK